MWALVFTLLLAGLFISSALPQQLDVQAGQPAPFNIKAPSEFIDRPATEHLRQEAREQVSDVYEQDPTVMEESMEQLDEIFSMVHDVRQSWHKELEYSPGDSLEMTEEQMEMATTDFGQALPVPLGEGDVRMLLQAKEKVIDEAHEHIELSLQFLFAQGIKPDSLSDYRRQMTESAQESELPETVRPLMGKVGEHLLQPNLLLNIEETERRKQMAAEGVTPEVILRGQIIVPDGQIITSEDIVRLRDAGLLQEGAPWKIYAGSVMFAFIILVLVASYLAMFQQEIFSSEPRIVLIGLTAFLTLFACRFLLAISPYLLPVAAGTILLAVLLNGNTALVVGIAMSLSVGVLTGGNIIAILLSVAGGTVGAISASTVSDRTHIMRSGVAVAACNLAVFLSYLSYAGRANLAELALWKDAMWGVGNGVLAAVMAIGLLPFKETIFGVLTPVKLLELSNPNHPLLRRLLQEAPGTYHHSMMVANLAESAAEAVGGDSLLARVGSYYHDVGKARRPYFFVENQFADSNPHDKLSANLSALTVISHVRDGLEMAEEEGLPERVIEFISEHHGTTLATYFYNRALEQRDDSEDIAEENFRYPGPKPQSKETAVVMLADAVEASVRAMSRPSPDRIRGTVREIIHERLEDGQLDRCDLTFQDLDRICESFTQVLAGAFHRRVEYPEQVMQEIGPDGLRQEEARNGESGDDNRT